MEISKEQNEKQAIEEFENDLRECHMELSDENMNIYTDYSKTAENMVAKGYRKQGEGEWIAKATMIRTPSAINYTCSVCGCESALTTPYCPNCGAHMKGGAE